MPFRSRSETLEAAIDALTTGGEGAGLVTVHGDSCLARWGAWCDCTPVVLLVPPSDPADLWLWLRRLDVAARPGFPATAS